MKRLALAAIRHYQRHLSPHKGFCCAYRHHTGRAGCSQLGYRAIQRYGLLSGIVVLRRRLIKCGVAHRRHITCRHRQAGFCDVGCDLDCGGGDNCSPCDFLDWDTSRKNEKKDEEIHIPPHSGRGTRI